MIESDVNCVLGDWDNYFWYHDVKWDMGINETVGKLPK